MTGLVTGAFRPWLLGGVALVLCGLTGAIWWQSGEIERRDATIAAQDRHIGEVTAANAGLAASLFTVQAFRAADDALILKTFRVADDAAAKSRNLDRKLKEAMRRVETVALDVPWPADVINALCLRYLAASGRGAADTQGDPPRRADAGTAYPPAAQCGGWRNLTPRDTVEWTGMLLDHAGDERLDKAALGEWADRK